jgi:hypothetical protein
MAEPDASPKLLPSTTGNLSGYAPISWMAVAALAVAGGFLLLTFVLFAGSITKKQSLIEPWLLFFPILAVILAFVARRQIAASEGTRTGTQYANYAWYIGVIGGLCYATYLFAIEFTVRNDAERELLSFVDHMTKLDPANPQDPSLYSAIYEMIPPGQRNTLSGPKDAAGMDAGFKDVVLAFRSTDLVRICSRNPGEVSFKIAGLVDWDQKPSMINCSIRGILTSPEGEHDVVIGMKAAVEDNSKRRWMVALNKEGFVKGRRLTPYGWMVEYLEQSGRQFTTDMMSTLGRPNLSNFALLAFVMPGWDAAKANKFFEESGRTTDARMAMVGPFGSVQAMPPGSEEVIYEKLFARTDAKPFSDYDRAVFRNTWYLPQRLTPPGATLKQNTDTATMMTFRPDTIEMLQSAELILSQEGQNAPTARAKIALSIPANLASPTLTQLKTLKDAAKTAAKTPFPPDDMQATMTIIPWRITRITSDLKPVPVAKEAPGGGGPGG